MVQLPPNSTGTIPDTKTVGGKDRFIDVIGDGTAANTAAVDSGGSLQISNGPPGWSVVSTPAAATQATATKAAGGGTVKHVCTSLAFSIAVDGTHAQTLIQVNLRDGATGAGTILWSMSILKAATEGMTAFALGGLKLIGTANTAMTLEFSAAGVTGSIESVSLTGYDLPS